jgi:hypothetical protein
MPTIARPRAALAQPSRDAGAELQHPSPHRFVGDVEPSFGQQFLDIAVAQGEAEVEPDRLLDDLGRKVMTAVAERSHADILSDTPLAPDTVFVTMRLRTPWAMGNSILELPNGDILASYRPTSTVIRIDRSTGNIVWKTRSSDTRGSARANPVGERQHLDFR